MAAPQQSQLEPLVLYSQARQALAAAHRIDEVKDIRDKAQAMAAYARQAKDTQLIEHATEIKVRAERRAGELLRTTAETGERASKGRPAAGNKSATLPDLGISEDQSRRWQQVASIPENHFEAAVQMAKNTAGEVTTAFLLRRAREINEPRAGSGRRGLRADASAPYAPETPKQRANALGQLRRMEQALGTISASARNLQEVDLGMTLSVIEAPARAHWLAEIRTANRSLRQFSTRLKKGIA